MVKRSGKRAVFYLLMSITIVGIIVASMVVFSSRFRKLESSSIEIVNNEFVGATIADISERGLEHFMEVASKKALLELSSYIASGNNVENTTEAFDSLVANGTINGTLRYLTPTLYKYLGVAGNYYFVLGFSIEKLSISSKLTQTDPWNVRVLSAITYKVNVPRSRYSAVIEKIQETNVSLTGIPDTVDGWKITPSWSANETYPSFLNMLEGSSASSEYGICRIC